MLATVGLRIAAEAISIFALTYSGDMIVLRRINTYNKRAKISFGKSVSIFMKPYKNAINRAINTSFVSVCILICISLKLPDNKHVKV